MLNEEMNNFEWKIFVRISSLLINNLEIKHFQIFLEINKMIEKSKKNNLRDKKHYRE